MRQDESSCLGQLAHQDKGVIFARIKLAFTHSVIRSDELNPPDVTASLIDHIPLLRSVIEVTSESPSP